ncbi:MAG: DNA polymerase III subunit delta' [Microcoleaceae cyanobacterium]
MSDVNCSSTPFAHLIGQPQAVELLTQAVQRDRIAPAYLFAGSPGIGRGLTARCFVELMFRTTQRSGGAPQQLRQRLLDRNHPDLLWVEPTYAYQGKRFSLKEMEEAGLKRKSSPQIRLDQIREISQFLSRSPLEAKRLVVVIEAAETLTEAPANALLKTLEEPGQATLILIAPGIDVLLPTLVSRCAKIPFYRLTQADVAEVLQRSECQDVLRHPEILAMAQGSPGQAIAHWQQLQAIATDTPELFQRLHQLPTTLQAALELGREVSQSLDIEAQQWLVDYLQQRAWRYQAHHALTAQQLQRLEQAKIQLRSHVQPRLVWECMFLELCPRDLLESTG